MPLSRDELNHLCRLAHLGLQPQEMEAMQRDISSVIDHVARLQDLNPAADGPPTAVNSTGTVVRPDDVRPSWEPERVLANAPRRVDDLFEVQAIFD